jgi:hypothetical protein
MRLSRRRLPHELRPLHKGQKAATGFGSQAIASDDCRWARADSNGSQSRYLPTNRQIEKLTEVSAVI